MSQDTSSSSDANYDYTPRPPRPSHEEIAEACRIVDRFPLLPSEILFKIFSHLEQRWLKRIRLLDRRLGKIATEVLFTHLEYGFPGWDFPITEALLKMYGQDNITRLIKTVTIKSEDSYSRQWSKGFWGNHCLDLPLRAIRKMPNMHTLTFEGDWTHDLVHHGLEGATLPNIRFINFINQSFEIFRDDENRFVKEIIMRQHGRIRSEQGRWEEDWLICALKSFGRTPLLYMGGEHNCLQRLEIHGCCPEIKELAKIITNGRVKKLELVDATLVVRGFERGNRGDRYNHCPFFTLLDAIGERFKGYSDNSSFKFTNVSKAGWRGSLSMTSQELHYCWRRGDDGDLTTKFLSAKLSHFELRSERYVAVRTNKESVINSRVDEIACLFERDGDIKSIPCGRRHRWAYEDDEDTIDGPGGFSGLLEKDNIVDGVFPHVDSK